MNLVLCGAIALVALAAGSVIGCADDFGWRHEMRDEARQMARENSRQFREEARRARNPLPRPNPWPTSPPLRRRSKNRRRRIAAEVYSQRAVGQTAA